MNVSWLVGSLCLLPPMAIAVLACGRGAVAGRLVATQLATSIAIILAIALSFAFDQPSSIDVAVTLAVLTLPGTLVLVLFQERWL